MSNQLASSSDSKVIVVFGGTGLQGTALIEDLAKQNTTNSIPYTILVLSRNPTSGTAVRLGALPGVKIIAVEKDVMDAPLKVFEKLDRDGVVKKGEIYGVFSNQGYVSDALMVSQGKAIADASLAWGVKHLVYSSVDTGGLADTHLAAFEVKRQVENYILSLPASPVTNLPMGHTFLRPVQFMDNLLPTSPFFLKIGRTVLLYHTFKNHPERKHQMIAGRDIGRAGSKAFQNGPEWLGGVVRLAGDEFTMPELQAIYKEVMGTPITTTYSVFAGVLGSLVPIMREMVQFFDNHGFNVDIAAVKREMPETEDLRAFLKRYKESGRR